MVKQKKARVRVTKARLAEWGTAWLVQFGTGWISWTDANQKGFTGQWHPTSVNNLLAVMIRHKLLECRNPDTDMVWPIYYRLQIDKLNEVNNHGTD